MSATLKLFWCRCLLGLLVLPGIATRLRAQDFFHGGVSAHTLGRSGIYIPDSSDVLDALALNPAGLTLLAAPSANVSGIEGLARGTFSNVANTNTHMRSRPGLMPLGAIGLPLAHRWSVGIGVVSDFVSTVNWHYADAPGTAGADYGQQAEKSEILAYRLAAGAAYALTPTLSIGASVGLVYNENTLRAPFIFQRNPQLAGLKTLLDLHTHGWAEGGSLGLVARPTGNVMLTAAYSSPYSVTSHGHASGTLDMQFQAAGLPFAPNYGYDAQVKVKLPQSVTASGRLQATRLLAMNLQGDFVNFRSAFERLPVSLSHGTNTDINALLNSTSLDDEVPLRWSDQFSLRGAFDLKVSPHTQVEAGYTRRSSLVPDSTIMPLTGAIMKNALSGGLEHRFQNMQLAGAYSFNFNQSASVGTSGLLAGEFNNSHLTVGTQAVVLSLTLQHGIGSRPVR